MAESIVKFVLSKLTDVVVKEALLLYNIDEQVETVTRQLGWIQAFMKDADKKQITSERQKYWVKEVRDVAYLIEDAIDTFLLEVSTKPQKPTGMMESMKKKLKTTKELPAVHKLAHEITQIKKRMDEIEASKLRYGINTLGEDSGEIKLPIRPLVLPDIDPDIVGFKEDQDHVVKELLDETTKRRSVVSIWGAGGLGKTTLALKVYNCDDIKRQFELRIWVTISQKFKLIDILRKIAEQLNLPINPSQQPKEDVVLTKIHESLKSKKYLIILDDVWTDDLWAQIGAAFCDENNGSRVLITTRSFEVAKDADPTCEPYKLGFLTKELSVDLFLKKTLPNYDPNESTFANLSDITAQFVQKCGALPLALVVLGGLLSRKPRNYTAWSKVLQTMSWHTDGRKCNEIIGTSYEDLSLALKQCFMYFAAYPEDYEIGATYLLRMWVAEGFIPQEDNRTLEETAESYLEDLVQRSLIQVTSRDFVGSIEYCGIHDLLRDLAIQKAMEDNFLVVYSHPDCNQQSLSRARRVAVHHPDCDKLVMNQNLRTLLCFHGKVMPNCSKQKLLKVVSTRYTESIDVGMFEGLTQLRYLYLKGNLSDHCTGRDDKYGKRYLEKVIGTMNCIQTLEVDLATCGQTFDTYNYLDCAWNMKTLRHVWTGSSVPELPPSTELLNLQTLRTVTTNESWKTGLPHLPNLRTLCLLHHKSCSWMVVADFLGTLKNLISLNLRGSFSRDIFDMRKFPFYQNLQSLKLYSDNYEETPNEMATDVFMLPPHLICLVIHNCHFQQDVMPVLENLHCLKSLTLWGVNKTNRKIRCSAKGFNQLEQLSLYNITVLEDWEIEEGALPILRELIICGCEELCVPQGLRHLTNLQKLEWLLWPNKGKADEVRHLCKHVPSLILI